MILYSPVGMQGALGMCGWACRGSVGGSKGGGEVRGLAGLIAVVGGLWARLQASVKYMQYM